MRGKEEKKDMKYILSTKSTFTIPQMRMRTLERKKSNAGRLINGHNPVPQPG